MPPRTEPARYDRARVGDRGRRTIRTDPGGERDRAGARADPGRGAAEQELRERRRPGERDDPDPGDDRRWSCRTARADELRPEREEEAADRPRREHRERRRGGTGGGRRAGTLGRSIVRRKRLRSATGSGIQQAPTKAIANSASSTTYGRTRGASPSWTSDDETRMPRPIPAALATPFVEADGRPGRGAGAGRAAPRWPRSARRRSRGPAGRGRRRARRRESASMKSTVEAISDASATSSTGRRPTSSETRPASSSVASTPKAYVA